MSLALSPESQSAAESAMVAAFCPRSGRRVRLASLPDGAGGETLTESATAGIMFGVVRREAQSIVEGERTRSITVATLRFPLDSDLADLDVIEDEATGERWKIDGMAARQFLLNASCTLESEA